MNRHPLDILLGLIGMGPVLGTSGTSTQYVNPHETLNPGELVDRRNALQRALEGVTMDPYKTRAYEDQWRLLNEMYGDGGPTQRMDEMLLPPRGGVGVGRGL